MDSWSAAEAAAAWGVSERWVRELAALGRVPGAVRQHRRWLIPRDTVRPVDERGYRHLAIPDPLRAGFATVDALRAELARRRPLTPGEIGRLRQEFAVEFTYDTNAIEGSTLTLRETALVLEGITVGEKSLAEHLDAIGHRDAYAYVEDLAAQTPAPPITSRILRELHFLVLAARPADRGRFRTIDVRILGATRTPPPPHLIEERLAEVLALQAGGTLHPLARAARFHLAFEGVHPFIDGNGRTGRLLLNLMLLRAGYLPINIKYTDRRRYYDCFQAWEQGGDDGPMIGLVTGYAERRLRDWLALTDPPPRRGAMVPGSD